MRDSPAACVTLGLDLTATKLQAFALSAGIAGLGGALLAMWKSSSVGVSDFALLRGPLPGLPLVLVAVIGGITTVFGAIFGGFVFVMMPLIGSWYPALQEHDEPPARPGRHRPRPEPRRRSSARSPEAIEERRRRSADAAGDGPEVADGRARADGGRRPPTAEEIAVLDDVHRPELGPLRAGVGRAVTGDGEGPLLELAEVTVRFGGHVRGRLGGPDRRGRAPSPGSSGRTAPARRPPST